MQPTIQSPYFLYLKRNLCDSLWKFLHTHYGSGPWSYMLIQYSCKLFKDVIEKLQVSYRNDQ